MCENKGYDLIGQIDPSWRGELEISSVGNLNVEQGIPMHGIARVFWVDVMVWFITSETNAFQSANFDRILPLARSL